MNRAASKLLDRLENAIGAEAEARRAVRNSLRIQADLLRALRAENVTTSLVAARVVKILGLPPGMESRNRVAARLRMRTKRHANFDAAQANGEDLGILSGGTGKEFAAMGRRLIKKVTTTEEFVEDEPSKLADHDEADDDEADDDEVDDDEEKESDDDEKESSRSTRRRSRRY